MLVELISGKSVSKIRCLASSNTGCSKIFDDSVEIWNVILMFEHLKVYHPPFYEHFTRNIHQWSAAQSEKVDFFLYRRDLEMVKHMGDNYSLSD